MILSFEGHSFRYECEKICRIYFPTEKIVFDDAPSQPENDPRRVKTCMEPQGENLLFRCEAEIDGRFRGYGFAAASPDPSDEAAYKAECEKLLAKAMTRVLTDLTGITLTTTNLIVVKLGSVDKAPDKLLWAVSAVRDTLSRGEQYVRS